MKRVERETEPQDLLPLTPAVLHILLALADEERHGYGIMREVEWRTGGQTRLDPGTLYGSIKRMLADGLIEESDDSRRREHPIVDDADRVCVPRKRHLPLSTDTQKSRPTANSAFCYERK